MRPLTLTFQAFGSYPGLEVVDFDALGRRGLFVVTGPTGTGKTTVFDAMTFALFGELPGGRSADGEVRSHFASADIDTFVKFTFQVDGEIYTIQRSPQYERLKLKGEGTTTAAAKGTLQRDSDGKALATKVSECTKEVERLLGVTARQFQRVVLLPQGRFTDFLIATDNDREALLRQLFGGEIYQSATSILKDEMISLGGKVAAVDETVRHHLANADRDLRLVESLWGDDEADTGEVADDVRDEDAIIAGLNTVEMRRADRQTEVERLNGERDKAVARQTEVDAAADRYDRATGLVTRITEREAERDRIAREAADGERSAKARPVDDAARVLASAVGAHDAATKAFDDATESLRRGFAEMGVELVDLDPATVAAAIANTSSAVESQRQQLKAAADAERKSVEAEAELALAIEARDGEIRNIEAATAQQTDVASRRAEVGPLAGRVEVLKVELEKARENAASRSRLADVDGSIVSARDAVDLAREAYESTLRRFVLSTAPRLAAELRDGEACSVCGSLDHPAPASLDDGDVVEHDEVDRARAAWADAQTALGRLVTESEGIRSRLGALADESVESVSARVASAESESASAANAVRELTELDEQAAQLAESLKQANARHLEALTTATELGGRATSERAEARRLADVVAAIDESALGARSAMLQELTPISERLARLLSDEAGARGLRDRAESDLAAVLLSAGFDSVDEARSALLHIEIEQAYRRALEEWTTEVTTARAVLTELQSLGVPDIRPDVEVVAAEVERATAVALDAANAHTTAVNAIESCRASIESIHAESSGSADLRRAYKTASEVYRTCNGEAGAKIKLERWVLAGELDRVTVAANVHLARMTNHRFALRRDTESRGGLGLEVSDAHTGRPRATASLSGGEQFQASLSLALGLADVVSLGGTGSGRTFEALFVDEGFGSLDPTALDQAIEALMQLHATGRMVGAITHVEAMKQSLHVGIEVRRLTDGGGSTLTVNP